MKIEHIQECTFTPRHKHLRDVWEHATFLIKVAYDLEWAVTRFELLESKTPNRQVRAVLLLNIGITYALLAEYRQAERAFQQALPLHQFMSPLAHFLLGVVRFELAEYEQAQISFKLCACVLNQTDHNRDYRHLGLDFVLSHRLVKENEEIAAYEWTLKQKGRHGFRMINRLPAPAIFDTTILHRLSEVCCAGTAISPARSSVTSNTVYSLSSKEASLAENDIGSEVSAPIITPESSGLPTIARKPVPKKPMVPRAAQPETSTSELRMLTQFLKYTGPESSEIGKANDIAPYRGSSASQTDDTLSTQDGNQLEGNRLLRKLSTLTLKRPDSIRQMTRSVFSTPMSRLGSTNAAHSRAMEGARVTHSPGPQRRPTINTNTQYPINPARRAVFGTITESDRESEEEPQRISMDPQMIFSYGNLVM